MTGCAIVPGIMQRLTNDENVDNAFHPNFDPPAHACRFESGRSPGRSCPAILGKNPNISEDCVFTSSCLSLSLDQDFLHAGG